VFIGLNNFFAGLIARPQFLVSGFYAIPYYICPAHYAYESMVFAVFHQDDRPVQASFGSEFYEFLAENKINGCGFDEDSCIGTMSQYVDVFFGFEYSHENLLRNAIILGSVLTFARVSTWVALKYIRFST
jgi:hypothetical protein